MSGFFAPSARRRWILVASALLLALAAFGYWHTQRALAADLVHRWPTELLAQPRLLQFATATAKPLYAERCASCHGPDLHGRLEKGAPDLADSVWIYGDGSITDIENTILYGIRSGHPKAHNVTDMPAEGRTHQLSSGEVNDVAEYVLAISGQPHDAVTSERGQSLFFGKGNCFDCHAHDAQGNSDYGAPSLRGPTWIYGDDRTTLYQTIYNGRHGLCPAWVNRLTAVQVRALAVYLYLASHPREHGP